MLTAGLARREIWNLNIFSCLYTEKNIYKLPLNIYNHLIIQPSYPIIIINITQNTKQNNQYINKHNRPYINQTTYNAYYIPYITKVTKQPLHIQNTKYTILHTKCKKYPIKPVIYNNIYYNLYATLFGYFLHLSIYLSISHLFISIISHSNPPVNIPHT